ncbi:MAG: TIGR01777 family oxidoreductase [Cyclobacteriaceae bacterium]
MKDKILITGGTGLVGSHLTKILKQDGYQVGILTRGKSKKEDGVHYYHWDIGKKEIDNEALEGTAYIINLVGAGVADKKWTDERKKVILKSRTESTGFLYEQVEANHVQLKGFISASAIGIYGNYAGDDLKNEDSREANDFLAEVVKAWEEASNQFMSLGIRTVLLRIGVVLDDSDGALVKIAQPIRYGVGAPLGSGDQYMSWIHIDDLCRMFKWAVEEQRIQGVYNAVNPNPVTNEEFTKATARVLKKPLWLPNVPSFVLKLMLGEMASIVLGGVRVSCRKIIDDGFTHRFEALDEALDDLLNK